MTRLRPEGGPAPPLRELEGNAPVIAVLRSNLGNDGADGALPSSALLIWLIKSLFGPRRRTPRRQLAGGSFSLVTTSQSKRESLRAT